MIRLENVSKRYRIGSGHGGLRAAVAGLPDVLIRQKQRPASSFPQELWALRDVSFRLDTGEALGIVGRNGAGKTTILKLLSKITTPTAGRVAIDGRVSALIELGAGFHPELTGLENVYLYGAILGLTRREIDRKLQSIVDFAELHAFMDTPLKRYSSGMYARLAFSVAAHVDPDVLLVDEVLSVGDSGFQQKCLEFIHSFVRSGRTTVFISHNLYAVEQLCDQLIWLDRGRILQSGDPSRVLESYLRSVQDDAERASNAAEPQGKTREKLQVLEFNLSGREGQSRNVFASGEELTVTIDYQTDHWLERPHFCIWVSDTPAPDRPLFAANMLIDGSTPDHICGRGSIQCVFKSLPLMPKTYYVWLEVYGADRSEILLSWRWFASFEIVDLGLLNRIEGQRGAMRFAKAHAPFRVPYEWATLGRVALGPVPVQGRPA